MVKFKVIWDYNTCLPMLILQNCALCIQTQVLQLLTSCFEEFDPINMLIKTIYNNHYYFNMMTKSISFCKH